MHTTKHNRGFTAFIAVLVSALALAIGISIYDLLSRELLLSQTARESQYAIFAADAGAECALYWDSKAPVLNGAQSVFATSSTSSWGSGAINCNSITITSKGPPAADWSQYTGAAYGCPATPGSSWCTTSNANAATTTFSLTFSPDPYCATVIIAKWGNPSQTSVVSHGYNTCVANSQARVERALQVTY